MAEKIKMTGPLTKGYPGNEPLVQGEDLGGVFLANGSNFNSETRTLTLKYKNADGSDTFKVWNFTSVLDGLTIVYTGFTSPGIGNARDDSTASINAVKASAVSAYAAQRAARSLEPKMVNYLGIGSLIKFDTAGLPRGLYYNPWFLVYEPDIDREFLSVVNLDTEEPEKELWIKANLAPLVSPSGTPGWDLYVRTVEMFQEASPNDANAEPTEKLNILVKVSK